MKKLLLLVFLSIITNLSASAQFFQWAQKQDNIKFAPSLASGSSLLATTGNFYQTITIGNQTFSGPDSNNVYLAVHDHRGNFVWAKHIRNNNYTQPNVAIDANQNIIISGIFMDSLFIDGLIFKSPNPNAFAIYTVKFGPEGNLLWARSSDIIPIPPFLYTLSLNATSISTDGTGNVYLAGNFENSLTFNSTTLTSVNTRDVFVVKYSPTGTLLWATNTGNSLYNEGVSVKPDFNGNAYLTYSFNNSASLRGYVISKLSASGSLVWTRIVNSQSADLPVKLTVDPAGYAYLSGYYSNNLTFGSITLNWSQTSQFQNFLAKINQSGTWKWAKSITPAPVPGASQSVIWGSPPIYYTSDNGIGVGIGPVVIKLDTAGTAIWQNGIIGHSTVTGIGGDDNGNLFIAGQFSDSAKFSATTLKASSWFAGYLTKVLNHANQVKGTVFIDANSNGIKDPAELPYGQAILKNTPGAIHSISGADGLFTFYLPSGNSSINLPNPPRYYAANPASHNLSFSGINQTQTGKDFALQPIPNSNDVKITVTEIAPARRGFNLKYRITYYNSGTTILSDTIKLSHNTSSLTFVTSSVTPLSNSNGKMDWYYQNLQPNETRNIDVTFSVPINTVLGTPLTAIASINPIAIDLFQADNIDTLRHVVVGSYDPNDKLVDKPFISPAAGTNGTFLDYTIRFQNTGTDTAFTVVVTDKINSRFTLADFEMLSASHNYKLNITDGNVLEWRFENILLPDSNRNEIESHGFVRFRIKSKPGLVPGNSIANNAAIYFDYNAPVMTNYAVTKVGTPTGVIKDKAELQSFNLYPNPAKNYVMVVTDLLKNSAATVSLVNLLGQTISKTSLPANNQIHYQLPVNKLPKGVYIVQVETEMGRQTKRLVIQ